MFKTCKRLLRDETGAVAIEYALLAAGVGLAVVVSIGTIGQRLAVTFGSIADAL